MSEAIDFVANITYRPCDSSQVSAFGYDAEAKVLGVQFRSGGTYHYFGVEQDVFEAMCKAESVGKFVGQQLRGKFAYERQPDQPGEIVFGLSQAQEPKYTVTKHGRLVNRATGVAIPDDEPVFVFRAQDRKAIDALSAYALVVEDAAHGAVVAQRIAQFRHFQDTHPTRTKEPDSPLDLMRAPQTAAAVR